MANRNDWHAARLSRLRGVNLNLLLVFDTLYQHRSLTLAAEVMNLSQPALSHSLRKLRELLNDPLFIKGADGMTPTPLAHQMQAGIDDGLFHFDRALTQHERFIPATSTREFRIGVCDDAVSGALQPALLSHTLHHAPGLCLNWLPIRIAHEDQAQSRLEAHDLDAAIVQLDSLPLQLPHDHLSDDPIGCVGDPAVYGDTPALDMTTFLAAPQVALSHREDSPLLVNDVLRRRGLQRRIVAKTPQVAPLADLLPGTRLLAVVTRSSARLLCRRDRLRFYDLPLEVEPFRLCLLIDCRRPKDAGLAWLRGRLRDAAHVLMPTPGGGK